jgi:Zn-dependent protease
LLLLPLLGFSGLFFFATVFSFVLLHELAHSLVARAFGIRADKIVLTFIGGVATVEVPENPRWELLMASAGPLFNFLAAGLCFILIRHFSLPPVGYLDVVSPERFALNATYVIHTILYVNVLLGLFNIVPGFPMDGGRILRSLLALKMDYIKATQLSVSVGQQLIFPLLFLIGLLNGNFILTLISVVLFIASGSELKIVKLRSALRGLSAGEIALREVPKVDGSILVRDFIESIKEAYTTHHVVYGEGGRVLGVLRLSDLTNLNKGRLLKPVGEFVTQDYAILDSSKRVSDSIKDILSNEFVLVVSEKKVVGYLTPQFISDAYYFWTLKKAAQ